MTQDQYDQDPGSVRGDVVTDDQTQEFPAEEPKTMTRFQKVASALRGGGTDRDADEDQAGQGQPAAETAAGSDVSAQSQGTPAGSPPWVTEQDEAAMANSPISREAPGTAGAGASRHDYWDEPSGAEEDGAVAVTRPEVPVTRPEVPAARPEVPAARPEVPAARPEVPAARPEVPAARPGQATGALGDFSDLTYGNLIPDAVHYTDQWQQIQFKFVDDPQASVTEAADIVAQVTAKMEAAIQDRQRAVDERQRAIADQQRSLRGRWSEGTNADTEALRETLRMYKTFLDQLIGSRAS